MQPFALEYPLYPELAGWENERDRKLEEARRQRQLRRLAA